MTILPIPTFISTPSSQIGTSPLSFPEIISVWPYLQIFVCIYDKEIFQGIWIFDIFSS